MRLGRHDLEHFEAAIRASVLLFKWVWQRSSPSWPFFPAGWCARHQRLLFFAAAFVVSARVRAVEENNV